MKKDGTFQIFYRNGWANLTVFSPEEGGRPVYSEDILGKIKLLEIPPVRKQILYEIIDEASGEPRQLVEWPDGWKLGPDIQIRVSEDRLKAELIVQPEKPGGEPLSKSMLHKALKKAGVIFGILPDKLDALLSRRLFKESVTAALGQAPVHRSPARVEYLFKTERGKPFKELDYDRMDLKELNFIQNCKAGQVLARLLDEVPPKNGRDVYGDTIPAALDGEPPVFRAGTGTRMSDDGKEILAEVDGNVKLADSTVLVEPVITVVNVDYSNGNMDFNGTLDIQGRIADGFSINALGDIQIGKSVSRVHITSGGDMLLKAGISGNDEGELICQGDLYARYIENARIVCRGSLFVEEAIMHSRVKVEKDIILTGKRAEIFGGRIIAGGSVRCKKLGSLNEPHTELNMGVGLKEFAEQEKLEDAVGTATRGLDEIDTQLRQLKNAASREDPAGSLLEKLTQAIRQLEEKAAELHLELSQNLKDLHELKKNLNVSESSVLSVEQWIFGQVTVNFGPFRWNTTGEGRSKTVLMIKQGRLLEKGQ